jgi:beta-lactamase regulating signal transducer with metallopeptidase domain
MTLGEMALSNLLVALILAVIAALVGLFLRRPAVSHFLWALVLIKLVTPPLIPLRLSWPAASVPEAAEEEEPAQACLTFSMPVKLVLKHEGQVTEAEARPCPCPPPAPSPAPEAEAVAPDEPPAWRLGWWPWVVGAWSLGMAGWYVLAWLRSRELTRLLALGKPAGDALRQRVERLAAQIGAKPPRVVLLPGKIPPLVWGAFQPILVLPEEIECRTTSDGLDTLLMHELAHIHRRDPLVRWLEAAVLGPWWWCPLAWYASRELRESEERCCDAWVVKLLPGSKKAYAAALVDVLDFLADAPPPPLMASGLGKVADLKRRMTMILSGVTPAMMGRPASLAVMAFAALVLPLVPTISWAQAPAPEARPVKNALILKADNNGQPLVLELTLENDGPEVKALEADLAKRLAEVEGLRKKIAELRAATGGLRGLLGELKGKPGEGPKKKAPEARASIAVQVTGVTPEEAEALAQKIQALLQKEKAVGEAKVQVLKGEVTWPGGFRFAMPVKPDAPKKPADPVKKKASSVEERLDALLKEVEELKKEMKKGGGKP